MRDDVCNQAAQFQVNGEKVCETAIDLAVWNRVRADILKIEEESFPVSLADNEEILRGLAVSSTAIFLAFTLGDSQNTIGYVAADVIENFSDIPGIISDPHFKKGDSIYIMSVAVTPEWRGRGVGKFLMRRCLNTASLQGFERATAHIYSVSINRIGIPMRVLGSFANWYGTGSSFDYVEIDTRV